MAYPVYSQRFINAVYPPAVVQYEVPAGFRAVVRDIVIWTIGPVSTEVAYVQIDGGAVIFQVNPPENVSATYHWSGRQVLEPGELLDFYESSEAFTCCVSGYLLTLP